MTLPPSGQGDMTQMILLQRVDNIASTMSEMASLLHSLAGATSAGAQLSSAEREQILKRLDDIISGLNQDRRDESEVHRRIEKVVAEMEHDLEAFLKEDTDFTRSFKKVCTDVRVLIEAWKQQETMLAAITPQMAETLKLVREQNDRNPDTGIRLPTSDRALNMIYKAAMTAFATATALYLLARILPFVSNLPMFHPR